MAAKTDLDEAALRSMFERSQTQNPDKIQFSKEESARFQKSFEDPEFRKLFSEYMDELQDPKNREETEAYISQLEGEQKVPEGRELIRYVFHTF
jgi:dynein assembly factor 2, axonemal